MPYRVSSLLTSTVLAIGCGVAAAGELETVRSQFDNCDHHDGPADIHPERQEDDPEVKFFFLADIDNCDTDPLTTVQNIVKNLHPHNSLHFIWAPLNDSASLLDPRGGEYKHTMRLDTYDGRLIPGTIKYGATPRARDAPHISASFYPPPLMQRGDVMSEEGSTIVHNIEVDYGGSPGEINKVSIDISSTYNKDMEFISYAFKRNPGVIVALGSISDHIVGQGISDSLPSTITPLSELVKPEDIGKMPDVFGEGDFILLSPDENRDKGVIIYGAVDNAIVSPVAILTDKFEPIATASVTFLSP